MRKRVSGEVRVQYLDPDDGTHKVIHLTDREIVLSWVESKAGPLNYPAFKNFEVTVIGGHPPVPEKVKT